MRKVMFALFALTFLVLGGVGATTVLAKPVGATVQFDVTGTFSPGTGTEADLFDGAVTVESFVEQDGELAVQGTLTPTTEGLFSSLAVTIVASAVASEDAAGCTVDITTVITPIDAGFVISLDSAEFALDETAEPDAARELCRVVDTAAKDPANQRALARALNKVLQGA